MLCCRVGEKQGSPAGSLREWKENLVGFVVANMAELFVPLVTSQMASFQNGVI